MDSKRETEIRVFVKEVLQKNGIRFDKVLTPHEARNKVRKLNEKVPGLNLTTTEFMLAYLEIMRAVVAKYFAMFKGEITAANKASHSRKKKT